MNKKQIYIAFIAIIFSVFVTAVSGQVRSRISQTEVVSFPKNGKVKIQIKETINKPTVINVWKNGTRKKLAAFSLRNGDSYIPFDFNSAVNPITKLRVLENIEGLPKPLVQVLAIQPGGSDHSFWTILIGEVNGKIQILTPNTTENSIQGGVHFGSLGEGNGVGMAVFNFVWDDTEAHYDSHKYKVDLYKFNSETGKFVMSKSFTSKNKYEDEFGALKELGFDSFENRLNDFPGIGDYRETEDGIGKN